MRDIEYRGLSLDGQWVYGDLVKNRFPDDVFKGVVHIEYRKGGQHFLTPVKHETVGVFTGKHDIAGNKIYEFDIIRDRFDMTFIVILDEYENRFMGVGFPDEIWGERQGDVRFIRQQSIEEHQLLVTGTKFDNAEYQDIFSEFESERRQKEDGNSG